MTSYNQPVATARWQNRLRARWGNTVIIRSPYKDRPEWAITEKQDVLLQSVMAAPTMSEAARAAMLGVSGKMVHHNITAWIARGALRVVSIGKRGLKTLAVAKDWIIQLTPAKTIMEKLSLWRRKRDPQPVADPTPTIVARLRDLGILRF